MLRRDDGMNFSLHWTEVAAGTEMELTYAHHLEANLCIEGEGRSWTWPPTSPWLRPGVMYALDKHDHHRVRRPRRQAGVRLLARTER